MKTLQFGDKQANFSTSFAWCFIYKNQFKRDPVQVLLPVIRDILTETGKKNKKQTKEEEDAEFAYSIMEKLGLIEVTNMAWCMAKLVDNSIPEPLEWVASFGEDFGVLDIVTDVFPDAIESCFSSKKSSAPIPTTQK